MTANNGRRTPSGKGGSLVEGLARTAISQIGNGQGQSRGERLTSGAEYLVSTCLDRSSFDSDRVRSELVGLKISHEDIIDQCIPTAARALGCGWLQDELSFARVSAASARLFGLCKSIGTEWRTVTDAHCPSVLIATIGREDHLLGPTVLADQMRRRGYAVQTLHGADAAGILHATRAGRHDSVMISAASHLSLDLACKEIKTLRNAGIKRPVILGGAILEFERNLGEQTGADLVTDDLDKAIAAITMDMVTS